MPRTKGQHFLGIAMAQINSTVGDLERNAEKIRAYIDKSRRRKADLVIFPELAVTGYPPQDLLYERAFIRENKELLDRVIEGNTDMVVVIGFVDYDVDGNIYNAAAVFEGSVLAGKSYKTLLPTYDVFDEDRYFKPARDEQIRPISVRANGGTVKLGVEICEDLWDQQYATKVTDLLVERGADVIVNISASPFFAGKGFEREQQVRGKAVMNRVPFFYVNLVGGQDELVFDGQSLAVDASGSLIAMAKQFEEDLVVTEIDLGKGTGEKIFPPAYSRKKEVFDALVLGVRDYFRKTGFEKALVAMSGGIDSSLTTCIAVEALSKENVIGVSMPSRFSSDHSKTDAQTLAENLGICFVRFSVQDIVEGYKGALERPLNQIREYFGTGKNRDDPVADENIQPRVRGNCLMDISNRLKDLKILVLNTGNKTELALGYCTLYGDMTGGIGALGDVSKLEVYRLAEYVNEKSSREAIPRNVFKKRPSPELKDGQYDPFDFSIVSPMVDEIIENRRGKRELIEMGYPWEVVEDIYARIRRAEYKRRQAPPCIKVTPKAFGVGWKMPIVNEYSS